MPDAMGFVNLKKGRNGRGVSCLSVRRGGIPRKQGLYLGLTTPNGKNCTFRSLLGDGWRKKDRFRIRLHRVSGIAGYLPGPRQHAINSGIAGIQGSCSANGGVF
jgi:hypothetical protein